MTVLVSTDEWLNELRTRLPGISEDHLALELKSSLREFFTKSGFWMEELSPINIVANKDQYRLSHAGGHVMGVHHIWIDGTPIGLSTVMPKSTNPGSSAKVAYMVEHDLLQLFPVPTLAITGGLKLIVRLNPLPEMDNVPHETVSHFFDEVMDGVLGRLYGQPGKPFTNLIQSQYHLKRFRDGISMARDMGRRRFGPATRPWSFPQSWSTSNAKRGAGRVV